VDDLPLEQIPVNYSAGRADEGISENLEFEEAAKYRDDQAFARQTARSLIILTLQTQVPGLWPMNAITLTIPHLTAEGFFELCQANQDLQLECCDGEKSSSCPQHLPDK